ncbi:MAG: hypothetical protein WBK76_01700 [Candidatus Saccharimonadales bacterium]
MIELEFKAAYSIETKQAPLEDSFEYFPDDLEPSTELFDEATLEEQVLNSPEEPQTSWPESNPDGTLTEAGYLQRCRWRLGNVGHALDVVKDRIESEADAQAWLELKMAVLAAKSLSSPYDIVDPMIALEEAGQAFVTRLNIDMDAYQRIANK